MAHQSFKKTGIKSHFLKKLLSPNSQSFIKDAQFRVWTASRLDRKNLRLLFKYPFNRTWQGAQENMIFVSHFPICASGIELVFKSGHFQIHTVPPQWGRKKCLLSHYNFCPTLSGSWMTPQALVKNCRRSSFSKETKPSVIFCHCQPQSLLYSP